MNKRANDCHFLNRAGTVTFNGSSCTTYRAIPIELDLQSIADKLPSSSNADPILRTTAAVLENAKQIWSPAAVLRRMVLREASARQVVLTEAEGKIVKHLKMGHAGTFLKQAHHVILGAYSVGRQLEQASSDAAKKKIYLEGYLYDLISREVLAKVGSVINRLIEQEAASNGWKVGPLLSPGSVHGWELSEQASFCKLLDLEAIGIRCSDNGVLSPFNSLSFAIGIGPDYMHTTVGSPCEVCSRRDTCEMKARK